MPRVELWRNIWMVAATVATAFVVYIIMRPPTHIAPSTRDISTAAEVAHLVDSNSIEIAGGSALERKFEHHVVRSQHVSFPAVTATASVVAHFMNGRAQAVDRWQFQSSDVSDSYADWRRAQNDLEFAEKQLLKTRELADAQVTHAREVFQRLVKLAEIGTETKRDVESAKSDLIQSELQTKKDVFEAESSRNLALRNRAAAERTLQLAGIDPRELDAQEEVAIVVAQVPEAKMNLIHEGELCAASFYGLPGHTFAGRVTHVAPSLSQERRTLRVQIDLIDKEHHLKPGMFADVGLGTEPRDAILIPATAVIHVDRSDFVFVKKRAAMWSIQRIELGESHGHDIEVERGLTNGAEIIGDGAILLKPLLVQAVGS